MYPSLLFLLSVAFSTSDHDILLGRLGELGVGHNFVQVHLLPLRLVPVAVDREGEVQSSAPFL